MFAPGVCCVCVCCVCERARVVRACGVCERDRDFRECARLKNGVCVICVCALCVYKKERERKYVQAIGRVVRESVC